MNKTMYELHWHEVNGEFSRFSVTPITVIREGVLPGCTGVSITAVDHRGDTFQGSSLNYFETEGQAWEHGKEGLAMAVRDFEKDVARLQKQINTCRAYLSKL